MTQQDIAALRSEIDRIHARYRIADYPIEISFSLDAEGLLRSFTFQRWGDPDGSGEFGLHPFGGELTEQARFSGVTIPVAGRLGWHYGTERWSEGEFFRYRITELELLTEGRS